MRPDLNAPGWVHVAGEWRWTGAGAPPGGVAAWEVSHEDYCGYPDDCRCLKVRPHADARTTERYIKETVAGADERRKQPAVDDDLDILRARLAGRRPSALSEEAIRADERQRLAALLTDNASVFDGYGTAEAMRKALVVMLTLLGDNDPESAE